MPIFAWNAPLVSLTFLKRCLVLPILLFSSISLHWSLKKALVSLLAILWNCTFRCLSFLFSFAFKLHFFSQLFVRPPQTTTLSFCISFSWGWSWSLPPVQCHKPLPIILQALYQTHSLECICHFYCISSVQSLSHVWLFATPWITARQASLSITNSWSLVKLMSIGLVRNLI